MGYTAHLSKVSSIPARAAAANTAVVFPVIPSNDVRVSIPYIRLHAGAAGGTLAVLQTEAPFKFTLAANGSVITVPGIPTSLSGRHVVIRYPGGESKATTIQSQTGEALTLADALKATTNATLYLIAAESNALNPAFPLTASASTVLEADCPGIAVGREIGWPVVLYLKNTDGDQKIEGGTVAYIGV